MLCRYHTGKTQFDKPLHRVLLILALLVSFGSPCLFASVITFEGYADGTSLTTQYAGLTFSNATIITTGISLNEFEFPPYSGVNVAFDDSGPITISFASPVLSFGGYFTYGVPLTINGFDSTSALVASAVSIFSNNEALSGDPGSSPNEYIQVSFPGGISMVTLTGDPNGSSFTADDITYPSASIPEPGTGVLMLSGLCSAAAALRRKRWLTRLGGACRGTAILSLLVALMSVLAFAQVGLPAASPTAVNVKTPTTLTVSSQITASNVIAGSVNALRVDSSGHASVIGQLHDDGQNGDLVANDSVYTGKITLNEPMVGSIWLEVSIAIKGLLQRKISAPFKVDILPAGAPTVPATPDLSQVMFDSVINAPVVANEAIACFTTATGFSTVTQIGLLFGGSVVGRLSGIGNCYQFGLHNGSTPADVENALAVLRTRPEVTSADPDIAISLAGLPTEGDDSFLKVLQLDVAHDSSDGNGVTIALIDSGVDLNSIELAPFIIAGKNVINPTINVQDDNTHDHGTAMTGILAATAPGSKVLVMKAFDQNGSSSGILVSQAIFYAMASGARLFNLSYSHTPLWSPEASVIQNAQMSGAIFVAAAGNEVTNAKQYPAALPGVLSVGATDNSDAIWIDNTNPTLGSNYGSWVQIAAPGKDVVTTGLNDLPIVGSGTSTSTAFVSGTAALVRAGNPGLNSATVIAHLESTAKPITSNPFLGGRLAPLAALTAVSLSPYGNKTLADAPFTVQATDLGGNPIAAPHDITVTLRREVISQCQGRLFNSPRTFVIPAGQTSVSFSQIAGRDQKCFNQPITTRYTICDAQCADICPQACGPQMPVDLLDNNPATLDLTVVPASQKVVNVVR